MARGNGLSDADKTAVKEAARESAELQRKLWAERAEASQKMVIKSGVKFNDVADKAAFQDAMKPVFEKFLASNEELKPLVAAIQATQ